MIHPNATRDECLDEIGTLEREIERLQAALSNCRKLHKVEVDEKDVLRAALRDLVNRWSTRRGLDSAIQRARHILGEKP
jgi:dynactin complex subunit